MSTDTTTGDNSVSLSLQKASFLRGEKVMAFIQSIYAEMDKIFCSPLPSFIFI